MSNTTPPNDAERLRRIGEALYGPRWQRHMSVDLKVSPALLNSWLSGRRSGPQGWRVLVARRLLETRIKQLVEVWQSSR